MTIAQFFAYLDKISEVEKLWQPQEDEAPEPAEYKLVGREDVIVAMKKAGVIIPDEY